MSLLPLFILIPVGAAFLLSSFELMKDKEKKNLYSYYTAGAVCLILLGMALFLTGTGKEGAFELGGWPVPVGISLVLDGFSRPVITVTALISLICVIFSFNYMQMYSSREKFFSLFLLMVGGMNGILLTSDLFNLYVFMELAAVSSYGLVAYGGSRQDLEAAFKYLVISAVATAFILLGVGITYAHTGNLSMTAVYNIISSSPPAPGIYLAAGFFMSGFAIKAALIPFHAWLPDAHPAAPAPVSAMLSGVLIKTAGIYAMVRVVFLIFAADIQVTSSLLRVFGSFSLMLGVLLALGQWDFKRLLAYHSISQMGYIALAFGLATPLGIAAGLFHLLNHSVFKSLLFLNSGAVFYRTGTRDLREMGGLASVMPVTAYTSMVASLSISGLPPFNGFWSKLLIVIAALRAGYPWMAIWAVLGSILTLASFAKVQRYAFIGKASEKFKELKEVPFPMLFSMIALALLCLGMGLILLSPLRGAVLDGAADVLLEPARYLSIAGEGL